MKIALLGYGKLGRLIESLAVEKGYTITAKVNSNTDVKEKKAQIEQADVCIDFSLPSCILEHVKLACEAGKPIVIGTTGWYDRLDKVKEFVKAHDSACIYGNFSVGMIIFQHIVRTAARFIKSFDEYDIAGHESHHRHKVDAPSGTAFILEEILKEETQKAQIPFASTRCGHIPGTHTILFDSPCDTIELVHSARDRSGFARGALMAAEWVLDKKGVHTFQELVEKTYAMHS